ncbi:hypothetical protein PV04_00929 [Phialophora macrospora]|uniref:Uncharacterized protein n=1 Tax=Phialophora macrospora TaxID=1851006 RepID=A0A0D2GK35_9EURO|nr:hypothetical protein PV04_00929 [Phialophora macrospora]
MNVPQIQLNHLWVQWTLLYAERFTIPDDSQKAVVLLARRAKIYAYINELIADSATRLSDTTITGLAFGSLIEWQVDSLDLARQHLAFVRHTLLPQRDTTQSLSFFTGFCAYVCLLWVGLGVHAFTSLETLTAAIERFLRIQSGMQQHAMGLPVHYLKLTNPIPAMRESKLVQSRQRYVASRDRTFGASSTLRRFLVVQDPKDMAFSSHQLILLWIVNKILFELRDDLEMSAEFLDTLYRYVESHGDPSPFGSVTTPRSTHPRGSGLKTFTIIAIVGHISGSYLPKANPEAVDWSSEMQVQNNRPLLRFWESVDMVELLQLLPNESRYRIAQQLSAWLVGPQPGDTVAVIGDIELKAFGHEMRCAWVQQAKSMNAQPEMSRSESG